MRYRVGIYAGAKGEVLELKDGETRPTRSIVTKKSPSIFFLSSGAPVSMKSENCRKIDH